MSTDPKGMLEDPIRGEIEKRVLVFALLISSLSGMFFETRFALGIAAGSGIGYFSFRSLRKTLERGFTFILSGQQRAGAYVTLRHYMKLTVLFLLMGYLIRERIVDILALVAGLLTVPAALIITGIKMHLINRGGRTE